MCFYVTIFFIVVPILEVLLYWTLIDHFGFMPILMLTLVTSFVGSSLLKIHKTFTPLDEKRLFGSSPLKILADHYGLWLSGVLLLMPGFITDLFGAILLIPWCRSLIFAVLIKNARYSMPNPFSSHAKGAPFHDIFENEMQKDNDSDNNDDDIIDVEATPISPRGSGVGTYATIENVASKKSAASEQDEVIDVEFKVNNK